MSKKTHLKLQCPRCHITSSFEVWDSLNVTIDPDAKSLLFADQINTVHCPSCSMAILVDKPLLYHDMERKFCVQYYPPSSIDEPSFLRDFNPEGHARMAASLSQLRAPTYLANPHIVFDMQELIRYVTFRDRLPKI